jgi:hypothetical protein
LRGLEKTGGLHPGRLQFGSAKPNCVYIERLVRANTETGRAVT